MRHAFLLQIEAVGHAIGQVLQELLKLRPVILPTFRLTLVTGVAGPIPHLSDLT